MFLEHVGGMSGPPVFRFENSEEPALLGVFIKGRDGLRGAYFCSHAHFLTPDGRIDFLCLPPM